MVRLTNEQKTLLMAATCASSWMAAMSAYFKTLYVDDLSGLAVLDTIFQWLDKGARAYPFLSGIFFALHLWMFGEELKQEAALQFVIVQFSLTICVLLITIIGSLFRVCSAFSG